MMPRPTHTVPAGESPRVKEESDEEGEEATQTAAAAAAAAITPGAVDPAAAAAAGYAQAQMYAFIQSQMYAAAAAAHMPLVGGGSLGPAAVPTMPPTAAPHTANQPNADEKKRGKWTVEQDAILRDTVALHGGKNWKVSARSNRRTRHCP